MWVQVPLRALLTRENAFWSTCGHWPLNVVRAQNAHAEVVQGTDGSIVVSYISGAVAGTDVVGYVICDNTERCAPPDQSAALVALNQPHHSRCAGPKDHSASVATGEQSGEAGSARNARCSVNYPASTNPRNRFVLIAVPYP